MRPRITGTEMEWAVFTRKNGGVFDQADDRSVAQAINHIDSRIILGGDSGMLSNGGRYYKDVGSHPEYATPEDTSFMSTVANEFAGEKLVYDSFENAKKAGVFDDFVLSKRIVDDKKNTWGYHVSLLADSHTVPITERSLAPLGIHLATMNVFAGAGAVIPTSKGAYFTISQKMVNLNEDFNGSTHGNVQPLISLRSESLGDDKYSRVHITSLDANMSPWATWMKIGTSSLMLRMMERGYFRDEPYFYEPMNKVARRVAGDSELRRTVKLDDGKTARPLEVQIQLAEMAEKLHNDGLPDEEVKVLDEWKQVLSDLERGPEHALDRVEWLRKKAIIKAYMARHALSLSDEKVLTLDRRWSNIEPEGIANKMREGSWSEWMPPADLIENAYVNAPTTTRAFGRAALIRQYGMLPKSYFSVYWDEAVRARGTSTTLRWDMDDPYEPFILPKAKKAPSGSLEVHRYPEFYNGRMP